MSTKKPLKYIRPLSEKQCNKPPMRPSVNIEQAPPTEAYKRGLSMGADFIEAFDPSDASEAIRGFIQAVNERLLTARDKATTMCTNAEAALTVLREGATV